MEKNTRPVQFWDYLPEVFRTEGKEGPGFLVLLLEETGTDGIVCDGCKEFAVPMCMQYCRKSEDLKKILEGFTGRGESNRKEKPTTIRPTGREI